MGKFFFSIFFCGIGLMGRRGRDEAGMGWGWGREEKEEVIVECCPSGHALHNCPSPSQTGVRRQRALDALSPFALDRMRPMCRCAT